MRKLILLFMLPLVAFMLSCSMQDVPERHRGLAIKRPYLFGNAEVELLKPDIHAIAWTTDLVNIPVSPETISEVFDDMKTKDEEIVDFAVHIKSVLDDNGLANLYSNFGLDWYNQNIKESFRTDVRDICKNYSQTELTSNPAISREISDKLLQSLNNMLKEYHLPSVRFLTVEMGKVNPPDAVIAQIAQTAVQKQREKTEMAKENAEEARRKSESKRAMADKEYKNEMGFTNEQYLKDKQIQNEKDIAETLKTNKNAKILVNIGGGSGTVSTTSLD